MSVRTRRRILWLAVAGAIAALLAFACLPREVRMWSLMAPIMLYLGLLGLVMIGAAAQYTCLALSWVVRGRRAGAGFVDWCSCGGWWPSIEDAPPVSRPEPPRRPQ